MRISVWSSDVCSSDLRVPRETLAHRFEFDLIGESIEHRLLARSHRTLHELDDTDLLAMADCADHHAQCRCRLAFALARVHDKQTLFDRLGRDDLIMGGLLLFHLLGVLLFRSDRKSVVSGTSVS